MMKRIIALSFCIFIVLPLFSEMTGYTKGEKSTQEFTLMLNKSGVNKIYFTEGSYDESNNLIQSPISNNRHIFPILGENSNGLKATSISDFLCFVWERVPIVGWDFYFLLQQ